MKNLIAFLPALVFYGTSLQAQFPVTLSSGCTSFGPVADEGSFINSFDPSSEIGEKVGYIIEAAGVAANFQLRCAPGVDLYVTHSDNSRFLLYNTSFLYRFDNRNRYWGAYFLLAHEIGHHLKKHSFDEKDTYHLKYNELEADVFAGAALRMLGATLEETQRGIESLVLPPKTNTRPAKSSRIEAAVLGWHRQDRKLRGDNIEHPAKDAYMSLPVNHQTDIPSTYSVVQHAGKTQVLKPIEYSSSNKFAKMPSFPWPPPNPDCYLGTILANKLNTKAARLEDIDERLCRALDALDYRHRSYFKTPGGFALVTQMEQFADDGSIKERYRWEDYPVQEDFDGFWNYFKRLVLPNHGRFRVFVFVVTNDEEYAKSEGGSIATNKITGWASHGAPVIPGEYAVGEVGSSHRLEVLIYEFVAPQSTKQCTEKCPAYLNAHTHLSQSGLLGLIGF